MSRTRIGVGFGKIPEFIDRQHSRYDEVWCSAVRCGTVWCAVGRGAVKTYNAERPSCTCAHTPTPALACLSTRMQPARTPASSPTALPTAVGFTSTAARSIATAAYLCACLYTCRACVCLYTYRYTRPSIHISYTCMRIDRRNFHPRMSVPVPHV